jgi:hypothetical protein
VSEVGERWVPMRESRTQIARLPMYVHDTMEALVLSAHVVIESGHYA